MTKRIITFPSVYHALRAKKLLNENNIPVELIPVPRSLSDSCEGLAARVNEEYISQAVQLLKAKNVVMIKTGIIVE